MFSVDSALLSRREHQPSGNCQQGMCSTRRLPQAQEMFSSLEAIQVSSQSRQWQRILLRLAWARPKRQRSSSSGVKWEGESGILDFGVAILEQKTEWRSLET